VTQEKKGGAEAGAPRQAKDCALACFFNCSIKGLRWKGGEEPDTIDWGEKANTGEPSEKDEEGGKEKRR